MPDWSRFFALPLPLENEAKGIKDTTLPFVRITAVEYEGEPKEITLSLAKYGISIYADQDELYLPLSTLSNIMTDIATNHIRYNGENLYASRLDLNLESIEGYYDSEKFRAEMQGQERSEDVVRQCYADLCLMFDCFYGHPGVAFLDEAITEKGLDQALTDLGEDGISIREGLLSADLKEYYFALTRLFAVYLSDGHNAFISGSELQYDPVFMSVPAVEKFFQPMGIPLDYLESPTIMNLFTGMSAPYHRALLWGDEPYREYGNTAIIRLDSFMPDEAAWDSFYSGEGDLPEDPLGIVITGLQKASENPEIENIILDLSGNSGGSPDVMMPILAMTTGQNQLYGIQEMTGQKMTLTFETDSNFDGIFDEKDRDVRYDFNYGVLTSRCAFSCGNLFPFIAQDGGMVLIGEPTGGGSCCVTVETDAEGFTYMISSGLWHLATSEYGDVEGGCPIDLPIELQSDPYVDSIITILGIDQNLPTFEELYDDTVLDQMMNEWFASESDLDIAA